jgi:hypothetical protein
VTAWVVACLLTTSTAWAAVSKVASRVTIDKVPVLSQTDIETALSAPTSTSAAPRVTVTDGAANATPTTEDSSPTTTIPTTSAAPPTLQKTMPTAAEAPPTTDDGPDPTTISTTSRPPSTTRPASTTSGTGPTVNINTNGGTLAVACVGSSNIKFVSASPKSGYTYSPGQIAPDEIHASFVKGASKYSIEAHCVAGRVQYDVNGNLDE